VAGCGTGGTVTGAGQYLKSKKPSIQVETVQPAEGAVLSGFGFFSLCYFTHYSLQVTSLCDLVKNVPTCKQ